MSAQTIVTAHLVDFVAEGIGVRSVFAGPAMRRDFRGFAVM